MIATRPLQKGLLIVAVYFAICSGAALAVAACGGCNQAILLGVNGFAMTHWPDAASAIVTMFGEGLWQMALLSPFLLVAPRVNFAALCAAPFVLLCTHVPKALLHLPRPSSLPEIAPLHLIGAPKAMNAFPSGHAMVITMSAVVTILGCEQLRKRASLAVIVIGCSILVSWSRVAIGAHWPLDVLAGSALGVLCGYIGHLWATRLNAFWVNPLRLRGMACIYMTGAIVLAFTPDHYAAAAPFREALVLLGLLSTGTAILRPLHAHQLPATPPAHHS